MATKIDIIAKLKEKNIAFDENASYNDLAKLLKESEVDKTDGEDGANKQAEVKEVIVWLKTRAFVNESQRIDAGIYKMELPERIARMGANVVEVFKSEDAISPSKLNKMAEWAGVNPEKHEGEDLLALITSTPNLID